jgi:superoxide oxidase
VVGAQRLRQADPIVRRETALLAENKNLAGQLKEVHESIGTVGYFLIGAHAVEALFHHFVTRDNTLVRMLPGER